MARPPSYAFTIPSLHDDTSLDYRLYVPESLSSNLESVASGAETLRGAVVAHPYAPLGGCYDDPVVLSMVDILRDEGLVVGTFNFRLVLRAVQHACNDRGLIERL